MHRRGVVFLLCFLVAVVVVGGSGVRAPWAAVHEQVATTDGVHAGTQRIAITRTRMRME
jgi:hypothetical protein